MVTSLRADPLPGIRPKITANINTRPTITHTKQVFKNNNNLDAT